MERNLSTAFTDEACCEKQSGNQYDPNLGPLDQMLNKYAGIDIYQPTIDNVERFVREYATNELAFLPFSVAPSIKLIPQNFQNMDNQFIEDAAGVCSFKFKRATIELPFIIYGGELVPFDIIQVANERVPYSKSNMQKIIQGIAKKDGEEASGVASADSPYLGVEKLVNPTSSIGFLGTVMSIQDRHRNTSSSEDNHWVTASTMLDLTKGLDKIGKADMGRIEELIKEAAEAECVNTLIDDFNTDFEHTDAKMKHIVEKLASVPWSQATSLPNGTFISIPTIKRSSPEISPELTMTKGVVIKNFINIGTDVLTQTMILTQDGRMKMLKNGERMAVIADEVPTFKFDVSAISSLEDGEVFTAFNGNEAFFPCRVSYLSAIDLNDKMSDCCAPMECGDTGRTKMISEKIINCKPLNYIEGGDIFLGTTEDNGTFTNDYDKREYATIKLAPLKDSKFNVLSYWDYIKAKANKTATDIAQLSACISASRVVSEIRKGNTEKKLQVITTDPELKIITIKGILTGYLEDEKDLEHFANSASETEIPFLKSASNAEFVEVRQMSKDENTYNVRVSFVDRSNKFFKTQIKDFGNVEEYKAKGILKAIGFDAMKASELVFKARNGHARADLPEGAAPGSLTGAKTTGLVSDAMNKVKSVLMSPEVKSELAMNVAAMVMADVGMNIVNTVKGASEGLIGDRFEKTSMEDAFGSEKVAGLGNFAKDLTGHNLAKSVDKLHDTEKMTKAHPDIWNQPVDEIVGTAKKQVETASKDRKKAINTTKAVGIGAGVGAAALGVKSIHDKKMSDSDLAKVASTLTEKSKAYGLLAHEFEKVAMETKSEQIQGLAGAVLLSGKFMSKVAEVVASDDPYVGLEKCAAEISVHADSFEKLAYELVRMKVQQYANKNSFIAPAYLQAGVSAMEDLYNLSNALK